MISIQRLSGMELLAFSKETLILNKFFMIIDTLQEMKREFLPKIIQFTPHFK